MLPGRSETITAADARVAAGEVRLKEATDTANAKVDACGARWFPTE
jgi:hypothetical protein